MAIPFVAFVYSNLQNRIQKSRPFYRAANRISKNISLQLHYLSSHRIELLSIPKSKTHALIIIKANNNRYNYEFITPAHASRILNLLFPNEQFGGTRTNTHTHIVRVTTNEQIYDKSLSNVFCACISISTYTETNIDIYMKEGEKSQQRHS